MAVIKKTLFPENLDRYQTLVTDTNPNSEYFKITELSDTLTGGKNAFLIQGSEYLVPDTLIKIEIKDAKGNIIYHEPGEGIISSSVNGEPIVTEYYEGTSKVVAVHIYPDTAYGPATITILGELSSYNNNGLNTPIPVDWEGKYNVKWQKQINVNPALPNTTKIRFYKRPYASITETLSPIYTIVSGSKVESNVVSSFANVRISQMETFAGDVKRIKVFRTSLGDISDADLIQDILVESKELLTTYELSGSVVGESGLFTSETLQKLWNPTTLTTELTSSRIDNGVKLDGSGLFKYTSSLNLSNVSVYELGIDAFYSASEASNLGIYISGSNNGEYLVGTLNGIVPTKNLKDQTIQFSLPEAEPTASLYFSQSQGEWHLGNISLKLTQDTAFSPSEIEFVTSMPTVVGNETYEFNFEFYDVNNNYVPVYVTQSALFTGGNNNVGGTISLISASISQSLEIVYTVSSSISGTAASYFTTSLDYTNEVSASLTASISASVVFASSSIYNLSSSVSSSNATILSSSLSKVQDLADGDYSGSFISGNIVFAPVIGGQTGYFSQKFQVGNTNPIVLDASTSTRKIYVGAGEYNNTNTSVYMDSGGQFSLGNKLTYDGSVLSVNGSINVTGGNAATNSNLSSSLANAVTSASAAQTAAELFATSVGNNAVLSGSAAASSAQSAAISQALSYASSSVNALANGSWVGGSGTFITANSISSPIIAGNGGYISGIFVVGSGGSIVLDGRTDKKKIYIGSGDYGNSNTSFYVDNSGYFSLKDKLRWDGSTLSISGDITVTGGNAATTTQVSTAQTTANNAAAAAAAALQPGQAASDVNNNSTTISGGKIRTGVIQSNNHSGAADGSGFSASGMAIDLTAGGISAQNFRITSGGDAYFRGNITGASGTFGGSISIGSGNSIFKADSNGIYLGNGTFSSAPFRVTPNGSLTAENANLTGIITATAGQIGQWQISPAGFLQNSSGKLRLNPSTPGIEIYDTSDTKRLDIHFGALTYVGSNSITIDPAAFSFYDNRTLTGVVDRTEYGPASSFYVGNAGYYQGNAAWDAVTSVANGGDNFGGFFSAGRGVEIRDGSGNVVASLYAPGNSIYGPYSTLNFDAYTYSVGVTFPSDGTYYAYPYFYYYGSISQGWVDWNGGYWDEGGITLNLENNLVELTDQGMQILSSTNRYIRFPRAYGDYVLESKGIAQFDANNSNDYAVRCVNSTDTAGDALYLWAYDRAIYISNGNIWLQSGQAYKSGGGAWASTSDRRVKKNESVLTGSLELINKLQPKTFEFKNQNRDKIEQGVQIGFVAQDVEEVRPEWVIDVSHKSGSADIEYIDPNYYAENKSGSVDIKSISFGNDMTAILVGAIKELTAKVEMLEAKLSGSI